MRPKTNELLIFTRKVNNFLKEKREQMKLSTYQLGKLIGVGSGTIERYENIDLPRLDVLIKLMKALNFTIEDVINLYEIAIEQAKEEENEDALEER